MLQRWHQKKKELSQGEIFKPPDAAKKTTTKNPQNLWVNCVKTGQHNKTLLPASFPLATKVHLSLLLFLQRGPPRFNWVLMESKSPLLLQPLELDMLIPPQSALGFYRLHEGQSFCAKWPGNPPVRWMAGAGRHPLSLDDGKGKRHLGRNSHLALLSSLWEKLSRAAGYPSTQPVSWGYYSQWATFAFQLVNTVGFECTWTWSVWNGTGKGLKRVFLRGLLASITKGKQWTRVIK